LKRHYVLASLALAAGACASPDPVVDADAALLRAEEFRSAGRHAAAARAYARFADEVSHDPRADYAQFVAGEAWLAAGKEQKALAAFARLHERFEHSRYLDQATKRVLEIGVAWARSNRSAAEEILEQVTLRSPYSEMAAQAHLELGRFYLRRGRYVAARTSFDEVQKAGGSAERIDKADLAAAVCELHLAGRPVRNLGRVEAARERLDRLRRQPLSAENMQAADRLLARAVDLGGEHHLRMARFYLRQDAVGPALVHLRHVMTDFPTSSHCPAAAELLGLIAREAAR
jgi:tetratricopeptide (TPR) repeat protein